MGTPIARGYATLNSVAGATGLTPGGVDFLKKALDPFHDKGVTLRGIPDACEAKTMIREFRQQFPITAVTVGRTAVQDYEFQVSLLPFLRQAIGGSHTIYYSDATSLLNRCAVQEASVAGAGLAGVPVNGALDPITVSGGAPGTQCWPGRTYDAAFTWNNGYYSGTGPLDATTLFNQGSFRLIGAAFEITNTSSALNRGGTCTVYRVNSEFDKQKVPITWASNSAAVWPGPAYVGGVASTLGLADPAKTTETQIISLPLNKPEDCSNLPGTLSWGAEEGCYVVQPLDPECMGDFTSALDTCNYLGINQIPQTNNGTLGINAWGTYEAYRRPGGEYRAMTIGTTGLIGSVTATTNDYLRPPAALGITAGQTVGAFFTDLPIGSTFHCEVKWWLESIPDFNDELDLASAGVSAPYDPMALELYAKTVREMPTGCRVSDNPLGEWFESVMSVLSDVSMGVGAAIGGAFAENPEAGAKIGGYVGRAADYLGARNKRRRESKDASVRNSWY